MDNLIWLSTVFPLEEASAHIQQGEHVYHLYHVIIIIIMYCVCVCAAKSHQL